MTQENDKKIDARYQSIAYQLAKRISGGELYEGRLQEVLDRLIGATKTGFFPFDFFAFTLEEGDRHLDQDLRTTDLKNQTQALMMGYEYEGVFVQNPEASVILKPGMALSSLGGPLEKDHVERFFKGEPHES